MSVLQVASAIRELAVESCRNLGGSGLVCDHVGGMDIASVDSVAADQTISNPGKRSLSPDGRGKLVAFP